MFYRQKRELAATAKSIVADAEKRRITPSIKRVWTGCYHFFQTFAGKAKGLLLTGRLLASRSANSQLHLAMISGAGQVCHHMDKADGIEAMLDRRNRLYLYLFIDKCSDSFRLGRKPLVIV